MAAPILVAKATLFGIKHWKPILVITISIIILIVMFPVFVLSVFLPSSKSEMNEEYKNVAGSAGLDWIELVVYDTVRNNNDFSKVNVNETAFDFLVLDYAIKGKEVKEDIIVRDNGGVTEYQVLLRGGGTYWLTGEVLRKLPSDSYSYCTKETITWNVIESGIADSYSPITEALEKMGYDSGASADVSAALSFVDGLSGSETYQASFSKKTLIDLVSGFDEQHKSWVFDLYTSLIDSNNSFDNVREFYNTDPRFMESITLDAPQFRLGNISLVEGDSDVDDIFLGRIAALAEDYEKKAFITSGKRTIREQQDIWDNTAPERRGKYVAAPGYSRHHYGLAADVKGWMLYLTNKSLEKYGLWKPMDYERWHIEPIETKRAS